MKTNPRIFVSVPDDKHLDARRRALKRAITRFIAKQNFKLVGFEQEQFGTKGRAHPESWTVEKAQELIRKCDGVLVLALARTHARVLEPGNDTTGQQSGRDVILPTPYNHLEGALGLANRLPPLIVCEENMDKIGIFDSGIKPAVIPADAKEKWVDTKSFRDRFDVWAEQVRDRRDVFLGYCSLANAPAEKIRAYLEDNDFSVLDWARDFSSAGKFILEEIEMAASLCRCAVFLFTTDDELEDDAKGKGKAPSGAVPRGNVLIEAGYFTQARGKERVAIIRETGTKMPADFGGIIYIPMEHRGRLSSVKKQLVSFLNKAL